MGQAKGPLRVCEANPRYFTDGSGEAIYLTGAHTWSNLKDMGDTDPPPPFDFTGYLDFLRRHNHNFVRMWTWELTRYSYKGAPVYAEPFPWQRPGPGEALDGKPKFDLSRLNDEYFDRLRTRVTAARERRVYVSIMLFEGHGMHGSLEPWRWDGHPFNARNNANGIDGDPDGDGLGLETHTLKIPAVTSIQEAYVRKVIDTVNDLDNVLYEIANESGAYSTEWQYHMIEYIHEQEKDRPKQHPVGMTFQWAKEDPGTNENLFKSPAEWISPNPDGGYRDDPPAADGGKVVLSDTDHLWGIGGSREWVWKSFCRGLNPLFMDPYLEAKKTDVSEAQGKRKRAFTDYLSGGPALDPKWEPIRRNMGYTLSYANRMNLTAAVPEGGLASTGYCLASQGGCQAEYLVYLPAGGEVTVDLSAASGDLKVEWFRPETGEASPSGTVTGGARRELAAPFDGDAVLYLHR